MKWSKRFLDLAHVVAAWSKDSTKVGAIAVGNCQQILATGYNGPPRGVEDNLDRVGLPSSVNPKKLLWCLHAEANLVAHAARPSLQDTTVYVTHHCCAQCAALLINAGVKHVVYGGGTTVMPDEHFEVASQMFEEAGVTVERG